jgi:hypothetical protein
VGNLRAWLIALIVVGLWVLYATNTSQPSLTTCWVPPMDRELLPARCWSLWDIIL